MIINNNNSHDKHLGGCLDAPAVDESQETDTAGGQHSDAVEKNEEDEDDDNDDTESGDDDYADDYADEDEDNDIDGEMMPTSYQGGHARGRGA